MGSYKNNKKAIVSKAPPMGEHLNAWIIAEELQCLDHRNYEGFIYCITDIETGQIYIGKKSFWHRTKKTDYERVESDWRNYMGSKATLIYKMRRTDDANKFERRILQFVETEMELAKLEAAVIKAAYEATDISILNGVPWKPNYPKAKTSKIELKDRA